MSRIPSLSRDEMNAEQRDELAEDHQSAMRIRRACGRFTTHPARICLTVR